MTDTQAKSGAAERNDGAQAHNDKSRSRANLIVAIVCLSVFGGMIGMSYASVPLYRVFCQVTGFGRTTQVASSAPEAAITRTIRIRFDANVGPGLNWKFQPKQREIEVPIGATAEIAFEATNLARKLAAGSATFNVTPEAAGSYFNKLQCFCFTETALSPGESMDMPVVFFVDPAIVDDPEAGRITTITLSYTFFPTDPTPESLAADEARLKEAAEGGERS